MTTGWLLERMAQSDGADDQVHAAADYFLASVAPEALGLGAAAEAGAALLYAVPAEELA